MRQVTLFDYFILLKSGSRGGDDKTSKTSWKEISAENDEKVIEEARKLQRKIVYIICKDKVGENAFVKLD